MGKGKHKKAKRDEAQDRPLWGYLAGPMTGYPNYNFDTFHAAATALRAEGYYIVNPAESHGGDQSLAWEEYLSWDLDQIRSVDFLVALEGWQDPSATGARIEIPYAIAHSIPVYQYDEYAPNLLGYRIDQIEETPRDVVKRITQGDNFGWVNPHHVQKSMLQKADELVNGRRQQDYAHPMENFQRIVDLWNAYLSDRLLAPLTPEDHALMMVMVKIARLQHTPDHEDSIVDIAGYAGTYEKLVERRREWEQEDDLDMVADLLDWMAEMGIEANMEAGD